MYFMQLIMEPPYFIITGCVQIPVIDQSKIS